MPTDVTIAEDHTLEGLVHDLKNVFETIHEAAEVLSREARHARLAATLQRNADRGNRILTSYFEQSQASQDLEAILDSATEFAGDFLQAVRGPALEFSRSIESGLRLRGNPAAWERVFMNLFLNAAQAMEDGGTVAISASRTPAGVEVTVIDDGPGIAPKILPHIFEPGFSTRARRSGLGLHIVKTIVEKRGGRITPSNRANGRGAQFHILLPAACD